MSSFIVILPVLPVVEAPPHLRKSAPCSPWFQYCFWESAFPQVDTTIEFSPQTNRLTQIILSTYPANTCGTQLGYMGSEAVRHASCNNHSAHTDR
jgi:hypothetical protein